MAVSAHQRPELAPAPARPRKGWAGRRKRWLLLAPMVPGLLLLVGLSIYPTVYSLVISFYRWNLNDPLGKRWGGWHNFDLLLHDGASASGSPCCSSATSPATRSCEPC
jgi:ABC-type sugar transport system permease subunit